MDRLYGLFDRADAKTFQIIENNTIYSKIEFKEHISLLAKSITELIPNHELKRFYIDIQDRFSFFALFLALKKINATIVLIPIEIQPTIFFETESFIFQIIKKLTRDSI